MDIKESILDKNLFELNVTSNSVKDVIKQGVSLLAKEGLLDEDTYYKAICDLYDELGPYFCLCPGVMMPHARPENGAKGTGFSLITLKNPLQIENIADPVYVILSLVASNNDEHLSVGMNQVSQLCSDEKVIEKLKQATSKKDLEAIINEVFK